MPSTLVDLRCDRRLLDYEFDGYKLNLQALPQYKFNLCSQVDRVYPDDVQYSFIHAKLFALHNHLVVDHWDPRFSIYYVDTQLNIYNITFENINNTFKNTLVYNIPKVERKPGHFNVRLAFPSSCLAVVSDGAGFLHIINTGQRIGGTVESSWRTMYSGLVLGENKYFTIVDTRTQENNEVELLHCLLQSVEQTDQHFNSILSWTTFENDGVLWKQSSFRQFEGRGTVHYSCIESGCTALYLASDNVFKLTHDSEREVKEENKIEDPKPILYTWLQTSDDITITLKLETTFDKNQFIINVSPTFVKISYAGKDYVNGVLRHKVDSELTTWNVQDTGYVDILITKVDSIIWDELIEGGDKNGEQIMDANLVEEVHRRLSHLCSETPAQNEPTTAFNPGEFEECDAPSQEDTFLNRFDIVKHKITHRVPLSVHHFLFQIKLETHQAPAIVLRHDVDACIWQPYAELVNTETWPLKHIGTLLAFGYVQSSKTNRKFTTCSPNFSYSVVCEATRHIFIYQHAGDRECELRRRAGGTTKKIKVGQQRVVNIDQYGEVLGIEATNEYLFVLMENTFLVIGIH